MAASTEMAKRETQRTEPERLRGARTYRANTDIVERDTEYLVVADMPGAKADAIRVDYEQGRLSITAQVEPRQADETAFFVREYGVGDFHRSFQIGEGVDAAKIKADVSNGVLTLHLPKSEAAKARTIEVKAT